MGSGNSTPAKVKPTNPVVKQLLSSADNDIENKDIPSAIESYQKAEAIGGTVMGSAFIITALGFAQAGMLTGGGYQDYKLKREQKRAAQEKIRKTRETISFFMILPTLKSISSITSP